MEVYLWNVFFNSVHQSSTVERHWDSCSILQWQILALIQTASTLYIYARWVVLSNTLVQYRKFGWKQDASWCIDQLWNTSKYVDFVFREEHMNISASLSSLAFQDSHDGTPHMHWDIPFSRVSKHGVERSAGFVSNKKCQGLQYSPFSVAACTFSFQVCCVYGINAEDAAKQ